MHATSENHSPLHVLSPIDGRYWANASALSPFFSEYALIRQRVMVELRYLKALSGLSLAQFPVAGPTELSLFEAIETHFGEQDALRVKELEKLLQHDVKAVEYYIREKLEAANLGHWIPWIHFGLTSQDVNNTAIPWLLRLAHESVLAPELNTLNRDLSQRASEWDHLPMLAHTHGQPASPTRLGKEMRVFEERIGHQSVLWSAIPFAGKFGGATGNFNAHHIAYPLVDWHSFADDFLRSEMGLHRYRYTTQIEHYDNLSAYCDNLCRINTIWIDLARDVWQYISMGYFRQLVVADEVGSSAMPHKINPIQFENAEGNLGWANAQLQFLSSKLPISRLQRDLTDSTVLRNLGVPLAHTLIAWQSLRKGLSRIDAHPEIMQADLERNWGVVAEAIQTVLRREGHPQAFEWLKDLTRTGQAPDRALIHSFIEGLPISHALKEEMLAITPWNYLGM
ncbi:MAG: adenylosuccinate lyase [Sphingomonadales bacterium]|nr:adenylosuccinate lyase [Sphingomonadales bacterium]